MIILSQASQPSVIVWTQLSPEEIALRITIYSALATSAVLALFGLLKLIVTQWFGLKSAAIKAQEDLQDQANANSDKIQKVAAAISPNVASPSVASIDEIAKGTK